MWDRKDIITLLILIRLTVDSQTDFPITDFEYESRFTFNLPAEKKPPAAIDHDLGTHGQKFPTLNVTVREVREAFHLTLLAVPESFMNESGKCHNETVTKTINKTDDIHQYMRTWEISNRTLVDGEQWKTFEYIFSGCYYVLMTNDKRESWQANLGFLNTSYPYIERKVRHVEPLVSSLSNDPLETEIIIPLSCLKVCVKIYELDLSWAVKWTMDQLEKEVKSNQILPSEECILDGGVKSKDCNKLDEDKNLMFESTLQLAGGVQLGWKRLSPRGGVYFFRITSSPGKCHDNETFGRDMILWRLLREDIFYPLDPRNVPDPEGSNGDNTVNILPGLAVVVLSIALLAVLICFIKKFRRNKKELKEKLIVDGLEPLPRVIDGEKLKHILLVYARGDPEFMTEMRKLRYRFKQKCKCEVHDVFSAEDFSTVAKLGPHEWVTSLLIDGSKLVWVDTPQLRSYFNDQQMQNASTDFRDAAIPFAIKLATSLFQNPTTQYRCHFVVRVTGFEVENGRDDDPLRVVSPHARYYIPRNFVRLCGDITTTSVPPKYKQNPEV